jgi:hypothetical protein
VPKRRYPRLLICLAFCAISCSNAALDDKGGITRVWAVDETEKIRQEDVTHVLLDDPRNAVWDGDRIAVFGAKNEVVGFQIVLIAANEGVDSVQVRIDSLSNGRNVLRSGNAANDPFDFRGREIELFFERYLRIEKRSEWWLEGARPLPDKDHLGSIPDALVPYPVEMRRTGNEAGFSISSESTQTLWVDVYIPSSVSGGVYRGEANVAVAGKRVFSIPIMLTVFDFALPDTTHLSNQFFWAATTAESRHGVKDSDSAYWSLFRNYARTFHRHRMDLVDGRRTLEEFQKHLAPYYTGEAYTTEAGYEGPGQGVGNGTYSIGTYDQPEQGWVSGFYPNTREVWQRAADAWEGWFSKHAPRVLRFKYLDDEAPYSQWQDVKTRAGWIRSSAGPGKALRRAFTTRISSAMVGAIDLWLVEGHAGWKDSGGTSGFDIPRARERQAAGDLVGIYNGMRPSYGDPSAIDDFAADARINPWICWKYKVDHYFYWETAFYADKPHNIWRAPRAGSLLYTGQDTVFPAEDRHLRGPVMSIRLKNLRRGMQDYEYLTMARQLGIPTAQYVDAVVQAAFNDYNGTTFTNQSDQPLWAQRGYVFERSRRALGELIEQQLRSR